MVDGAWVCARFVDSGTAGRGGVEDTNFRALVAPMGNGDKQPVPLRDEQRRARAGRCREIRQRLVLPRAAGVVNGDETFPAGEDDALVVGVEKEVVAVARAGAGGDGLARLGVE